MERSWLFTRLAVPAGGCPDTQMAELVGTVVAELVTTARSADPGTKWFFDRLGSPMAAHLSLGFHAVPAGLDTIRRWLRSYEPGASFTTAPYVVRDAARGGPLAYASSELALALLSGDGPWLAGLKLPLAVAHLRYLTGLMPAADRLAFLFLYWQDRSQLLTGAHRRDLAAQADTGAEEIVLAEGNLRLAGTIATAWWRYLTEVADIVNREQPPEGTPRGFLLAHHAQLTHQRWGISPAVDSLAAMALRLAMVRNLPTSRALPPNPTTESPVDAMTTSSASQPLGASADSFASGPRQRAIGSQRRQQPHVLDPH